MVHFDHDPDTSLAALPTLPGSDGTPVPPSVAGSYPHPAAVAVVGPVRRVDSARQDQEEEETRPKTSNDNDDETNVKVVFAASGISAGISQRQNVDGSTEVEQADGRAADELIAAGNHPSVDDVTGTDHQQQHVRDIADGLGSRDPRIDQSQASVSSPARDINWSANNDESLASTGDSLSSIDHNDD